MKIFISGLVGAAAGLAIFGIGCTKFYPGLFLFWIFFGLAASFASLVLERQRRLLSVFITGLSMWITEFVANSNSLPKMTTDEVHISVAMGGILTALIFLPAFLIGLILKCRSKKTSLTPQ